MDAFTPLNQVKSGRRTRPRRAALVAAGLLVAGLALAACGGSSKPGSTGSQGSGVLAYSACMRSHGVPDFPDPDSSGGINDKQAVENALQQVSNSQAEAAQNACQRVYPGSLSGKPDATITASEQQDYLNAAACMRSHGIPNFPDPTFSGGHVNVSIPPSIDQNSAQFTHAAQICTKLIPAGLPYSASAG